MIGALFSFVVAIIMIVAYLLSGRSVQPAHRQVLPTVRPPADKPKRHVQFNQYVTERKYGKKSGDILSTDVVRNVKPL